MASRGFEIRGTLERDYADVYTPEALAALNALAPLDADRKALMAARIARRAARARERRPIAFLDPAATIGRTAITVQDARDGKFDGSEIPADLQRQWIQGTGPGGAARTRRSTTSLRNVAYALLSGADGWMFDGEDALGQVVDDVARQPAQPEAGDRPRPAVPGGRRAGGRRDERVGGRASSAGRSSPTGGSSSTSRPRSSAPAACTSTTGTSATPAAAASRPRSSTRRSTSSTTTSRCASAGASLVALPAEDPDRRGSGALERHPRGARSSTSACRSARSRSTCWSSRSRPASS